MQIAVQLNFVVNKSIAKTIKTEYNDKTQYNR